MPYRIGDIKLVKSLNARIKAEGIKYVNYICHDGLHDVLHVTIKIDNDRHVFNLFLKDFIYASDKHIFDGIIYKIKEKYNGIIRTTQRTT